MKLKQYFWIIAVVAVLAASYILPKQMLQYEQEKTLEIVQSEDLSEALSKTYEMTLTEKLQLLAENDIQTVIFEMPFDQQENVVLMMQQELTELETMGFADTAMMLDMLQESSTYFEVYNMVYIDAERILRAYHVVLQELLVIMDVDSGKILKIGAYSACWERAESVLNTKKNGELLAIRELEIWAKYYAMRLEDAKMSDSYQGKDMGWAIISGYFVDEKESRVGFSLNFNIRSNMIAWGATEEELLNVEREAIDEAE